MTEGWGGSGASRREAQRNGADLPQDAAVETPLPVADTDGDPHDASLDELFAALVEGRSPEIDAHDNVSTVSTLDGAFRSADSGERVALID
jgi:hypothetical protein